MIQFIVHLRFMQLFAHAAHNLVSGPTFAPDHDFFGAAYEQHEADFDSTVERVIGKYGESHIDFAQLTSDAAAKLASIKPSSRQSNDDFFKVQLENEEKLCSMVDQLCQSKNLSEGIRQMLGNMADLSEVRQYKIKQRLA